MPCRPSTRRGTPAAKRIRKRPKYSGLSSSRRKSGVFKMLLLFLRGGSTKRVGLRWTGLRPHSHPEGAHIALPRCKDQVTLVPWEVLALTWSRCSETIHIIQAASISSWNVTLQYKNTCKIRYQTSRSRIYKTYQLTCDRSPATTKTLSFLSGWHSHHSKPGPQRSYRTKSRSYQLQCRLFSIKTIKVQWTKHSILDGLTSPSRRKFRT